MNELPAELVDHILETVVRDHHRRKNAIFQLRLVCRAFDRFLAPILLKTLQLDFLRLKGSWSDPNAASLNPHVLAKRGSLTQALYVDTMVVRDVDELEHMEELFRKVRQMQSYLPRLRQRYSMSERTFTPAEFRHKLYQILLYTPNLERFRLNLPFQLIGRYSDASTMILSNALAALAENLTRSEKDPELKIADLKVLVLESVANASLLKLWNNPIDVRNIAAVFHKLEHIVFGIRRQDYQVDYHPDADEILGQRIWTMLGMSGRMKSICISTLDNDDVPVSGLKESLVDNVLQALRTMSKALPFWREHTGHQSDPRPESLNRLNFRFLRALEFKRVELHGPRWMRAMESFPALEELFLSDVYLQTFNAHDEPSKVMWIGLPDERPPEDHCWIALRLRMRRPRLRVIKAFHLAYHRISTDRTPVEEPVYDLEDPCTPLREFSQRFVEVAIGYKQPLKVKRVVYDMQFPGEGRVTHILGPVHPPQHPEYLAATHEDDHLVIADLERPDTLERIDTCTLHHQLHYGNPTSGWSRTIDGWFPNCNSHSLKELHNITDMACTGMKQLNEIDSERINVPRRQEEQTQAQGQGPTPLEGGGQDADHAGSGDAEEDAGPA